MDLSHFMHKEALMKLSRSILSPPVSNFDPLGSSRPNTNSNSRNFLLSQMSRGEVFRLNLIGNVFRLYMPSLLLGNYAWYAFIAPDVFVSADQLWELMRPFSFSPPAAFVLFLVGGPLTL